MAEYTETLAPDTLDPNPIPSGSIPFDPMPAPSAMDSSHAGAENHFRLYFFNVISHLLSQLNTDARLAALLEQFPFLAAYQDALAENQLAASHGAELDRWWEAQLAAWEAHSRASLPLKTLVEDAGYSRDAVRVLIAVGLVEEDARFGTLYAALQEPVNARRPCMGLLGWLLGWELAEVWAVCRPLLDHGFLACDNRGDTRAEWLLRVPAAVWDTLRGLPQPEPHPTIHYQRAAAFPLLTDLILPAALQTQISRMPELLAAGQIDTLILRGMQGSGRRTTLGAVMRALGRDLLLCDTLLHDPLPRASGSATPLDETARLLLTPLALLTAAVPVLRCDPPAGEALELAPLPGYLGPLGVTIGRQGGLKGALLLHALSLTLPPPAMAERRRFWQAAQVPIAPADLTHLAETFLITGGAIHKAAHLGAGYAALAGRTTLQVGDAQQALTALNRQALETLATPLDPIGDWSEVVVDETLQQDLHALEARCRRREHLRQQAGSAFRHTLNRGVRALFGGPSGTGKTLAARALAGALALDLYRVDLSAVVNKYIGETERNLNQLFSRAEELNIVLLLDEGDALMTRRTDVSNANDRYANLETNYLLQRLETYEGIVVITTNAAQRIDSAFLRRLDVVIEFAPPDIAARWRIWQSHLPHDHTVSRAWLEEIAARCALTGGQIRNAALHATLLAMGEGAAVGDAHLDAALQREYRKAGAALPMRPHPNR